MLDRDRMHYSSPDQCLEFFNTHHPNHLPSMMAMKSVSVSPTGFVIEMPVEPYMLNINGSVHGGSIVALADTTAGWGCLSHLPEGASGFTTIELKCNFMGRVADGVLSCTASLIHSGRSTQVWDCSVIHLQTDKRIAEMRCTQMIFYPGS